MDIGSMIITTGSMNNSIRRLTIRASFYPDLILTIRIVIAFSYMSTSTWWLLYMEDPLTKLNVASWVDFLLLSLKIIWTLAFEE